MLEARRQHFGGYGEPHEEDRTYEARLNGMLDYYLYDHRPAEGAPTTIEEFLASEGAALEAAELAAYRDLARNVHALFEVRKLLDGKVRLRDLFTGKDHEVTERRQLVGLEKGDLLEARLLPLRRHALLLGRLPLPPAGGTPPILAEVKRRKKAAGKGGTADVKELLALLSRMAFKQERYRNVRLESIYDFSPDGLKLSTPRG